MVFHGSVCINSLTMKTLFIIRHGEAPFANHNMLDDERILVKEGIDNSKKIGRFLSERKTSVDKIISSPAKRTMQTANIIAPVINYSKEKIQIEDSLYLADGEEILDVVYTVDDKVDSLMIFGHNPGVTELANLFFDTEMEMVPTTATVSVNIDCKKWADIILKRSSINFVVFPEMID